MIDTIHSTRARAAALAVGLALSLSVLAAPAVVAQSNSPEGAVQGLLDDIEAKNFDALADWFCPEFADQASALDMSELTAGMPPGVDAQAVIDAFTFDATVDTLETTSQSDTEATVRLVGSLSMQVDIDALEPVIVALFEATGQEATPDMIDMAGSMLAAQLADQSIDISDDVTVVPNPDGTWGQICSLLGGVQEETTGPGESMAPTGTPGTTEAS